MEIASGAVLGPLEVGDISATEKLEIVSRLSFEWAAHLSAYEYVLVSWLIANTVVRGKRYGHYSRAQLIHGVRKRGSPGEFWTKGTGMAEATLRRAIASARAKGIILTSTDERGTAYVVNTRWSPHQVHRMGEATAVPDDQPRDDAPHGGPVRGNGRDDAGHVSDVSAGQRTGKPVLGDTSTRGRQAVGDDCIQAGGGAHKTSHREDGPARAEHVAATENAKGGNVVGLNIPKKGVHRVAGGLKGGISVIQRGDQSDPPSKRYTSQEVNSGSAPPSASASREPAPVKNAEEVGEIIKRLQIKNREKTKNLPNSPLGYTTAWSEARPGADRSHLIGIMSKKQGGILKKALSREWKRTFGSEHEFIEWSVQNWNLVRSTQLGWMKKEPPPTVPDPWFFIRFIRYFIRGWLDKRTNDWLNTLPGNKQLVERFIAEGHTREAAIYKAAEQQVRAADREQMGRLQQQAQRSLDMAKIMVKQARDATRFTAENPHPRAHENRDSYEPLPIRGGDGSFHVDPLPRVNFDDDDQ